MTGDTRCDVSGDLIAVGDVIEASSSCPVTNKHVLEQNDAVCVSVSLQKMTVYVYIYNRHDVTSPSTKHGDWWQVLRRQ